GQYEAQAVLGAMLFRGQSVPRDASKGLMWLILARDAATPKETWITDLYNAAVKQSTEVERNVALVHVEQWIEQSRTGQRTPSVILILQIPFDPDGHVVGRFFPAAGVLVDADRC